MIGRAEMIGRVDKMLEWLFLAATFWVLVALLAVLLAGCAVVEYTHGETQVRRTAFLTDLQFGDLEIHDKDGGARVEAAKSEQIEAAKAIAEGVAKGLAAGVKP